MFRNGTTTAEAKTGYGLELNAELAQLETLVRLDEEGQLEIAPHLHAGARGTPEYKDMKMITPG